MKPCEICGRPGQRHHIIYRSHGGMNIDLNYAYLCPEHHTGPAGVHGGNADLNELLKLRLQKDLERIFSRETYHLREIAEMIGYDRRRLGKRMKNVRNTCGEYAREDIIRFFMGGMLLRELRPAPEADQCNPMEGFILLEDTDVLCGG